jgi:methylenetetrahydrofolate dehydrogenase (NADP+)/methenyltetrahydrofolate cyclohydrolase
MSAQLLPFEPAMTAKIINGNAVAAALRVEFKERVKALAAKHVVPGLAVILVGANPASLVYVRNKIKACNEVGIRSFEFTYPDDADQQIVLDKIAELNARKDVHGILVQLPLPPQFSISKILQNISVEKDVDGFHLYNVGGLVVGDTVFPPCTPYGVVKLLEHEGIEIEGKNVVVVGASNIVGKPNLIVPQMVKQGAVVIDVGINRLPDGRLVGDTDFEGLKEKASYITPVPGGVGPMTVTMLLHNTIASAERQATGSKIPAFA